MKAIPPEACVFVVEFLLVMFFGVVVILFNLFHLFIFCDPSYMRLFHALRFFYVISSDLQGGGKFGKRLKSLILY